MEYLWNLCPTLVSCVCLIKKAQTFRPGVSKSLEAVFSEALFDLVSTSFLWHSSCVMQREKEHVESEAPEDGTGWTAGNTVAP